MRYLEAVVVGAARVTIDVAAHYMDDDIREQLHSTQDWDSDQEFVDAYCGAHLAKFGEYFVIN